MNQKFLSLSAFALLFAVSNPAWATETPNLVDFPNEAFDAKFVEDSGKVFPASTSAKSLESFKITRETTPEFVEPTNETEVAQYWNYGNYGNIRKESGLYLGGNLGFYFPTFADIDTGFGGGGYLGYRFNKNIGVEAEVNYLSGSFSNFNNLDYDVLSFLGNVRGIFPLGGANSNSKWDFFVAGGLGASTVSAEGRIPGLRIDESSTDFALQGKLGLGYQFNGKLDGFLQLRYINIFTDGRIDNGGFFSPELGLQYNF